MSSITFGGLATGMDTDTIVTSLMEIERQPLDRLEQDREYIQSRLAAFTSFEEKLEGLLEKFENLDSASEIDSYQASAASEDYFSATCSSSASTGNYQIEVQSLALQQKDASDASYASRSEANFTSGTLTVNGTDIVLDNDSLDTLVDKINAANTGEAATGVSASIINDGNGYRMILTGDDAATTFTTSVSGIVTANGYAEPTFTNTQAASLATVVIDGVTVTSTSNTFEEAIPGVTLTLADTHAIGESTSLTVSVDQEGVKEKIQDMVTAYNGIMSFIDDQQDADWGHDAGFRSVKRRLQSLLVTSVEGSGNIGNLAQLGLETQRDGTLTLDTTTLEENIANDLVSVEKLLAGEDGVQGIASQFADYLEEITDIEYGLLASREESTEQQTRRLDQNIANMEARLEKREEILRSQFNALEELVSSLNSTSSFLTSQLASLDN